MKDVANRWAKEASEHAMLAEQADRAGDRETAAMWRSLAARIEAVAKRLGEGKVGHR